MSCSRLRQEVAELASAWISRNAAVEAERGQAMNPGMIGVFSRSSPVGFLCLDDRAFAARAGARRAPEARRGPPGEPVKIRPELSKASSSCAGRWRNCGASRFYRTAARPTEGGRAAGKAATLTYRVKRAADARRRTAAEQRVTGLAGANCRDGRAAGFAERLLAHSASAHARS